MLPFPSEEILPMMGLMFLRLGAPLLIVFALGSLAQRLEQLGQA